MSHHPPQFRVIARLLISLLTCLAPAALEAPVTAQGLEARGFIESLSQTTTCLQGTHFIVDPCSPRYDPIESTIFDLNAFACQHVLARGPNVGIECPVIDVQSITQLSLVCVPEVLELELTAAGALRWRRLPCASSYDLIRGPLPGPVEGAAGVDLGTVRCLGNDLPANNVAVLYLGPGDEELPPVGQAFFYLVRGSGPPYGTTPYGFSSLGGMRFASAGDCPV